MDPIKAMKEAGYKPVAVDDGEFKPLTGTYECNIITLRAEVDTKNDNAKYYQLELKPVVALDGDTFGENFTFRKRFYTDGEKGNENVQKMMNWLFTCGVEIAGEDEFEKAIGVKAYVRSWSWDNNGKKLQMFTVQKPEIAEKKRSAESVAF